jgi:hypothetical protein
MKAGKLEHSIFMRSSMEPIDSLEMHVLARAYRAAWRSIHARDPVDRHVLDGLDVVIIYGGPPQDGASTTETPG